ncbi:MAG: SDR family NAD(P)-dependent oxidoreductase [Hyphomicrobiales bacterium]|nr:SDR family NAD(P)-dependent oxidoreductase [Hyphomicrobiales bacterium]
MSVKGRTILITGSTDGVGRFVAERLASDGADVIVHGRDQARGEALVRQIAKAGGEARFYRADFSSLAEVKSLASAVRQGADHLDVLVNNAGIGFGERELSADGFELRFAVNYLAPFLLTRLLLPWLERAPKARVVNVASAGQQAIDFSDVMLERGYSGVRAYRQSKLAQILFTLDLAEELKDRPITVNCLHPATFMDTTMVRRAGVKPSSTVEEGATAILQLVASPALEGKSGLYFDGLREARADRQAYDEAARKRLRALSFELVGAPDPLAR